MTAPQNVPTEASDQLHSAATDTSAAPPNTFADEANSETPSLLAEFVDFLRAYGVWWLTPLVIAILLLAGLAYLSTTAAAPFIYPLF